jgi:predicted Zn-dependent protease
LKAGLALGLCLFLTQVLACARAPYTGRRQLLMVSESREAALGEQVFKELKRRQRPASDPKLHTIVQRVGRRLAAAAHRPDFRWEFVVFEEKEANAFCLPGGKVGVFTGLFKYIESDGDLATVLAHEIGHVLARHAGERLSQSLLADLGGLGLSLGLGGANPYAGQAILQGYQLGTTVGFMLPYSRKQEYEADRIGLILMAKAGYDPALGIAFWEKWSAREKGRRSWPQFLSTHPKDANRLQAMKACLPEARRYYVAPLPDRESLPSPPSMSQPSAPARSFQPLPPGRALPAPSR